MVSEWFAKVKWIENLQKLGLTGVILAGAMYVGSEMLDNDRQFRESIVENDRQFREQSSGTQRSFARSLDRISDAGRKSELHLQEATKFMQESAAREAAQAELSSKILEELKRAGASQAEKPRGGD